MSVRNVVLRGFGPGGDIAHVVTKGYDQGAPVPPPVAAFSGTPLSGTVPLSVTFTDLSTGSPTSWAWDFGDGNTSTVQNPTHAYTVPGTYTVALTATNSGGSDTDTKPNYVTSLVPAPVADFNGSPTSGTVPLSVFFTDLSTNSPTSWLWDFGDGATDTAQNPTHTYAAVGTYTVELTATNSTGSSSDTKVAYITVASVPVPPPTAPPAKGLGEFTGAGGGYIVPTQWANDRAVSDVLYPPGGGDWQTQATWSDVAAENRGKMEQRRKRKRAALAVVLAAVLGEV